METPYPVYDVTFRRDIPVERSSTGHDLEDDDTERIDVSLPRSSVATSVLRRYVALCPGEAGDGVTVERDSAGNAEVTQAGTKGGIEHDVARLDVAMKNRGLILMMNVVQAGGYVPHDGIA